MGGRPGRHAGIVFVEGRTAVKEAARARPISWRPASIPTPQVGGRVAGGITDFLRGPGELRSAIPRLGQRRGDTQGPRHGRRWERLPAAHEERRTPKIRQAARGAGIAAGADFRSKRLGARRTDRDGAMGDGSNGGHLKDVGSRPHL